MSYIFEHTTLGFCWWDLLALLVVVVAIVIFVMKHRDMKKEEKDLEDKISELFADDTIDINGDEAQGENL